MATVNFQCGNCKNLMAVGAEHIGQQIRCPHCQAVVVAPAPAAPPPPAPIPAVSPPALFTPPVSDHEDIFAPPEASDDLFGQPEGPRVEMPAPSVPEPAPNLAFNGPANSTPADEQPFIAAMTSTAPPPSAPVGDPAVPSWMETAVAAAPAPEATTTEESAALGATESIPALVRKPRDSGGWFLGLVFVPLVSYSILVSILAGYLFYLRSQETSAPPPPANPLEKLPSFDPNDEQHSTHLKLGPASQLNRVNGVSVTKDLATGPVPPAQFVALGKKLQIGDLEVEPLRLTRQKVYVVVDEANAERCAYPSLVLHLRLKNISNNVVFQPMDTLFNRRWAGKGEPPLTMLELSDTNGPTRFFGGPAAYHPPAAKEERMEWVSLTGKDVKKESQPENKVLEPGQENEFFACTDGGETLQDVKGKSVAEAVENYHGKLLWRIHLRCGVTVVNEHRYAPISTVIGVEFTDEDYRKSS